MAKLIPMADYCSSGTRGYMFWCPGCKENHSFRTVPLTEEEKVKFPYLLNSDGTNPVWAFDNDLEMPTFSPSLLYKNKCHLFVENGKIRFLPDCSHELAGQTVNMVCFRCHTDRCRNTDVDGPCFH